MTIVVCLRLNVVCLFIVDMKGQPRWLMPISISATSFKYTIFRKIYRNVLIPKCCNITVWTMTSIRVKPSIYKLKSQKPQHRNYTFFHVLSVFAPWSVAFVRKGFGRSNSSQQRSKFTSTVYMPILPAVQWSVLASHYILYIFIFEVILRESWCLHLIITCVYI
jgi:hypothetical protein